MINTKNKSIKSKDQISKLRSKMKLVCSRLSKVITDPKPELIYYNNFQFLISVVLSAHSTDKTVNKCMEPYYKKGFDINWVLNLSILELERIIKPIGLYKNKARFVMDIAKKLHSDFNDSVPNTRDELLTLPGVGEKTASVVLSCLFNQPFFPVDTHVYRLTKRLGFHSFEKKDITKVEPLLLKITDIKFLPAAHHLFLLYGRYTCKSQNPICKECVIKDLCEYISH